MEQYLKSSDVIDFENKNIQTLAKELAKNCTSDEEISKNCFTYVRDEINHTGDFPCDTKTCNASEVLEKKTGWCYAKSHLLVALLRANKIPAALCYQRLSCSEYEDDIFCLHGLTAIYLKKHGWYRVDARGNKKGVDAQFTPPYEKLAFKLGENEYDIEGLYAEPISCIVNYLKGFEKYEDMVKNLPDEI